jgi:membrane fusion protein, heavy metal efflux system
MNAHTTVPVEQHQPKHDSAHGLEPIRSSRANPRRKKSGVLRFAVFILVLGAAGGGLYAALGKEKSLAAVNYVKEQILGPPEGSVLPDVVPSKPTGPWNGLITVTDKEQKTIGFKICSVLPQTQPIRLEVNGTTDYDQNTLNKVRPRFDNALVEKVYVSAGQSVKKGDPLLELRSAELGLAKNDCRTNYVQWDHDHKYLTARKPLHDLGQITNIVWTDTVNDEKKSRLTYFVSREKLMTYGMTDEQIDKLLEGLSDDNEKVLHAQQDIHDITRMTVLSPIDGVVVVRDVVPGNFYDQTNIMLTISPMTELWVWGNVFESDQDKVHLRQNCDILFRHTNRKFPGQVESIANGVDPDTRALRIRASIPNPAHDLAAGMQVQVTLQIPPLEGDTVIPRNALAVINGEYYAFVVKEGTEEHADKFERRKLEIEQENTDLVVVKKGLKSGEKVVSNGSLILSQLYEDQSTVDTGLPVQ